MKEWSINPLRSVAISRSGVMCSGFDHTAAIWNYDNNIFIINDMFLMQWALTVSHTSCELTLCSTEGRSSKSENTTSVLILASARHIRVGEIDQWQHWSYLHCHDWSIYYRKHILYTCLYVCRRLHGYFITFERHFKTKFCYLMSTVYRFAQITRLIWDTKSFRCFYFLYSFLVCNDN